VGKEDATNETTQPIALYSKEFLDKIKQFKADMHQFYADIGAEKTPKYDGAGREIIKKRPDGYDYLPETYMRSKLDQHFPGWSWVMGGPPQFIGTEWTFVWGTLSIIDEHLLAFNINPPIRKYSGTNGVRVKFKSGAPHTAENVIDIGNDVAAANSKALKIAINRLTRVGDDVYGKRIDEEGAGSLEEIIMATNEPGKAKDMFLKYIDSRHILVSKVLAILGVKSLDEIADYRQAYQTLKDKLE